MARNDPQVNFRMPAELKAQLEAAAAESGRTTTAELVSRLQASFEAVADPGLLAENHLLAQQITLLQGELDAWKTIPTILAGALRSMIEGLTPEELARFKHAEVARKLATAVIHGKATLMADVLADVMEIGEAPGSRDDIRSLGDDPELIEADAANDRREAGARKTAPRRRK